MNKFIRKAIQKLPKLTSEQIEQLIDLLADENEMLSVVLDSMEDGIIVTDLDNRIKIISKTTRRLLPMHNETDEKVLWAVISDHEIADYLELHMGRGDRILDEEFYVQKSSLIRVLSFSVFPLVRDKAIMGNIIMLRDITERKKSEAKYRRAENLASLTTLAASVAHEIKNPLASMGIHLQLMQRELERENCIGKESAAEYLDIISEEIERLNSIVVDFLFAVRPMDTRMKSEDINAVIKELLEFTKYELEQNQIAYVFDPSDHLPKIEIDKKYIKQALLNIIKNAIAAMPEGGVLHVSTAVSGDMASIDITDNGVGISEEHMNKIFEPYYTTKDFGSGLGLTVVYKVIREHGGEISLDSQEGKGTTFTITLPLPQSERVMLDWEGDA
ncbi:MAG: PAS domain S-box protein [Spirochaetia bacterium]|nr:PAS domain S-box protein [Spirochaetia bacterium]MCF7940382.1 PAS domain S-box protein [Spirochaetia bacterium]